MGVGYRAAMGRPTIVDDHRFCRDNRSSGPRSEKQMKVDQLSMMGIEMLGQCVDCTAETRLDSPDVTFKLKVLDIVYSIQVRPEDASTPEGAKHAWEHLLSQFFLRHAAGNRMVYSDGSRELTDEERKIRADTDKRLKLIR